MRKGMILLLCLLLLTGSLLSAAATESTVAYTGNAGKFLFSADGEQAPTNLFPNFRNVIPGDQLTQTILVKNDAANGVKIKLYLRSLGAGEDSKALLSQLQLTVRQEGDTVLYSGPADEAGTLADWAYLGTVFSGGEVRLEVTLQAPVTLDNAFQEQVGQLTWEFRVEELPTEPSDPSIPQTGDTFPVYLYGGLMALCLLAVILLLAMKRRQQTE